jgi:MFS family permease
MVALVTALSTVGGTAALRATRRLCRTTAMALGAALYILWCGASLAAMLVAPRWRPLELLAATVVMAAAGLLFYSRANAIAEATAPRAARGRYLAAFQYAFTVPGVVAPAAVALFSVAIWLPWLLVGTCAGLAVAALPWLAGRLPADAVRPESVVPQQAPTSSTAGHTADPPRPARGLAATR